MTLLETIDSTEFSDEGAKMFAALCSSSPTDEAALVVLAAAAAILARDAADEDALLISSCEFAEVAEEMRLHMPDQPRRPTLMLVGGSNHIPNQKEA